MRSRPTFPGRGAAPRRGGLRPRAVAVLAVAALVAGCSSAGSPGAGGPSDVATAGCDGPLEYVTGADLSQGQVQLALVRRFADETHIPVRIVELPDDTGLQRSQYLAAEQAGNTQYDVLNVDVVWLPELAADGAIQALPAEMATATDPSGPATPTAADGFMAGPLSTAQWSGQLWGLPYATDAGLLYYRPQLLRQVNAQAPATWYDMLTDLQNVNLERSADGQTPFPAAYVTQLAPYEGLTVNTLEALLASGDQQLTPDTIRAAMPASAPSSPGVLDSWVHDDISNHQVVQQESLADTEDTSLEAFEQDKALFLRDWPYAYNRLAEAGLQPGIDFDVAPLPGLTSAAYQNRSVLGGHDLAIAAHSRHTCAARRLISFLTSPAAETCMLVLGGMAPTRASSYNAHATCGLLPSAPASAGGEASSHALLGSNEHAVSTLYNAVHNAQPRPQTPYYVDVTQTIQQYVTMLINPPPNAADEARQRAALAASLSDGFRGR